MPEQHLLIFGAIAVLGLAIIILGFKFSEKTKKAVETTGAIIFHVGVFGILYHKVSLNLFISLVALVFSLFILIDPLKIASHVNAKIYRLFGYVTLFSSVAFSLDHFTGFPVWLWTIPLIIYLAPYLISPLRKQLKLVMLVSWFVVLSYVGLIGYVMYSKYNPEAEMKFVKSILPQLKIPQSKGTIYKTSDLSYSPDKEEDEKVEAKETSKKQVEAKPQAKIVPVKTVTKPIQKQITESKLKGPYLNSLQQADKQFIQLKSSYDSLKQKYDNLAQENKKLRQDLDAIKKGQPQENTVSP